MKKRGTTNGNQRGSVYDRRARKAWLMEIWKSDFPGYVRCYRCGALLDESGLTVDRIVPAREGGKYTRGNIRPACSGCNRWRKEK